MCVCLCALVDHEKCHLSIRRQRQMCIRDRCVTRQAVSRWERGETIPEVETLQALSRLFGVSINTLLGSPRTLVCQSCGMPLNDDILAKNTDGSFNEQYCMWCWDGEGFAQDCTMEEMVEHCLPHMPLGRTDPEACRAYMRSLLPLSLIHISEPTRQAEISYAVFCLKKKKTHPQKYV